MFWMRTLQKWYYVLLSALYHRIHDLQMSYYWWWQYWLLGKGGCSQVLYCKVVKELINILRKIFGTIQVLASLVAQMVKKLPAMRETCIRSLGREDPLERKWQPLRYCAWRIPWTEEPGGLQSMASHRVGHNRATNPFTFQVLLQFANFYPLTLTSLSGFYLQQVLL